MKKFNKFYLVTPLFIGFGLIVLYMTNILTHKYILTISLIIVLVISSITYFKKHITNENTKKK